MKKWLLTALPLALGVSLFAQFSDDFESYNPGDYLGASSSIWTTWSGATGGAEDVQVVNDKAFSGQNSIYFSSTAGTGGPQDVVLPFGEAFNSGVFTFSTMMYVESGSSAYFNFQAEETIGTTWALDNNFAEDGLLTLSNQSGAFSLEVDYPVGVWFEYQMKIDLTTNKWELYIEGNLRGSFSNPENQVASLDIYPLNGGSFWMDDIGWEFTAPDLPEINAGVVNVTPIMGLVTQSREVTAQVRNLGDSVITSFDLTYAYNGNEVTESFTGLNLSSLEIIELTFTQPLTLVAGSLPVSVTVSNVNGLVADEDPSDDQYSINLNPVEPAEGKMVIGEEGTGTWCGWCPRGAVAMDFMAEEYEGFFQGIAVHNSDPMVVAAYDNWMRSKISGFPGGLLDRGSNVDPSQFPGLFMQRITRPVAAFIDASGLYNTATRKLEVTLDVDFRRRVSGDWRIACVLIEDGVTGTSSGYNQSNYYSGGGSGQMGGYENLPNPVPASMMVYNDVARAIQPGPAGDAGFPSTVEKGDTFSFNYSFTLNSNWDPENMSVVGILIDNTGRIDNGYSIDISEFPTTTGIGEIASLEEVQFLAPNPTGDVSTLALDLESGREVEITIRNTAGQVINTRHYGTMSGTYQFPIQLQDQPAGVYMVQLRINDRYQTFKLVKQ